MATHRMISTRFWDDGYTSNLDPIEKLLFLYFLTNTSTNICGIYEIPLKKAANETGIDKEMVEKVLSRFTKDGKIFYIDGWICLRNFVKHQNQKSPTVQIGIQNELRAVPSHILEKFIGYGYGIQAQSHLIQSNLIKSNINTTSEKSDDTFDQFWNAYPRKEAKKKAQDIWKRKKLGQYIKIILDFISKAQATNRWKEGFIPHASTFLNQERWQDDISSYAGFGKKEEGMKINKF